MIELCDANGFNKEKLPSGVCVGYARNEIEHCFDPINCLTGVFEELGEPNEIVSFLHDLNPQTDHEWLFEDRVTEQDAILMFFVLFRDVQEHVYSTEHEHTLGQWIEQTTGLTEEQAVDDLDAMYNIKETKQMMRTYKRWRAIFLGDRNAGMAKVRRVQNLVRGKKLSQNWRCEPFTAIKYNHRLEKKKSLKNFKDVFERVCKERGGKNEMIAWLEENVGRMDVETKVSMPVAISLVKDAFKLKHMTVNSLQAKLDMGRDLIEWQDGAFVKLIKFLVETDGRLREYAPQDHPDYGPFFDEVLELL